MKRLISVILLVATLLSLSVPALAEAGDPAPMGNETKKELAIYPAAEEDEPKPAEEDEEEAAPAAPVYPEDDPIYRLNDGNVMTRVRFTLRQSLTVTIGEDTKGVYIAFYECPESVLLTWKDASGETVAEDAADAASLNQYFPVQEGAAILEISGTRAYAVSDVKTFDTEAAPASLPIGEPLPESCDLLVIAAQTANEQYDFAGVLPYYASQGYSCVQAFVSHKNRLTQDDAVFALRESGVTAGPLFGGYNYRNYYNPSEKMVKSLWKQKELQKTIESWILTCKPQVIVTQAEGGEGAEALRSMTAACVLAAVKALDEKVEVKKVYLHAADGEAVTVLDLSAPLDGLSGKTAAEAANTAYNLYTCNAVYHRTVEAQPSYTLAYTTVGEDGERNNLFEHVPADLLSNGGVTAAAATPEPTEEPAAETPAPTPEPTAAPQEAGPAPEVEVGVPDVVRGMAADKVALAIRIAPLLIGLILMLLLCITRHPKIGVLLLLVGLLASAALLFMRYQSVQTELVAAAAVTPEPTPAPTATPAPTPEMMEEAAPEEETPEETAEAAETKAKEHPEWDTYFRSASDPGEVVVFDYDNGKYEYRTDDLSILIDRRQTELPLTYYVAHIRMRNVDAFRPGFGTDAETGSTKCAAWEMARRYKAVLLITGDDMVHMEQDMKGIILRNGRYYAADDNEATMAMLPGKSMRIFRQGSTSVNHLFDIGVENTFAFGPILVQDGEVYKRAYKHRVREDNPRVGVGMIEPGHFVVIVVDGRLKEVSLGMPIMEFAELFKTEGCVQAFNMDGGASAAMVFMGEFINMRNTDHVRTMPDGLMWGYSEQVPSVDDPLVYSGEIEN